MRNAMNAMLQIVTRNVWRWFLSGALVVCLLAQLLAQEKHLVEAEVYTTASSTGQLMANEGFRAFETLAQPDENYPTVMLDGTRTFQTVEGFGGAFTDAASSVFASLPEESQQEFLRACFDPVHGSGYTLCRTTINSCDYSDSMYTYDDIEGDANLAHFTIAHELRYRIPLIKKAEEIAGGHLRLFASPWSPPAWMKTNGDMLHGGKLKPQYFQTWADYFVKYIKAYAGEGIPIWGVTVQNEPMAVQVWESCIYTADEEKNFVRDFMGPTFRRDSLGDVKIMIWDHNRGIMYQRAQAAYEDPEASKYIWGTAFHWYVGEHFDNVRMVHDAYPDKKLLFTEGSTGGSWESAYRLARNVINDLNNWSNGWVFWNLLLNHSGGPRHAGGLEGSNIISVDSAGSKVVFNPPFYVFEQFSKFIRPGARRIACTSNDDDILATAFLNPDGKVAAVIFNTKSCDKIFQLWIDGKVLKKTLPADGVVSIVF